MNKIVNLYVYGCSKETVAEREGRNEDRENELDRRKR